MIEETTKYFVFGDESGCWNSGNYYVRSWLYYTRSNFDRLRKEMLFIKHENNVKEIKWDNYKRNVQRYKILFEIECSIFITVSLPSTFKSNSYNIIKKLNSQEDSFYTGNEVVKEKLKQKLINAASHILFFAYYEKIHLENSLKAFVPDREKEAWEYVIDTPQCLDRDWEEIATDVGVKKVEIIKKAEENAGVEMAGIVAGCIRDFLDNEDKDAKVVFSNSIKSKMRDMSSHELPNPNVVFYKEDCPEVQALKKKLEELRNFSPYSSMDRAVDS